MLKLYFVWLPYLLIVPDVVRCKPDYLFNFEAGGWLKLHTTPDIWEEAFIRCHDEGAVLASPLHKDLANALQTQMTQFNVNGHIFLGTHDFYSEGDYVSVEGVPLSDMAIRWGSRGDRADTGDCLTMTVDGRAYYSPCKDPLPFICYRKLDNLTMNECGTFDDEYRLNRQTGSCYKVHHEKQTWTRAYRMCASEGGHLVILNDEDEADIVKDMFPDRTEKSEQWERFHVGLGAWGKERIWTTIHGEGIEHVFNKWYPGQPDNHEGIQNRGAYLWNGKLDDVSIAGEKLMFVCEKSPKSKRFEALPSCTEELIKLCNVCDESGSTAEPPPSRAKTKGQPHPFLKTILGIFDPL